MKSGATVQYTLRQVPASVDRTLRRRSKDSGKSLNIVAIDALARGLGLADQHPSYTDSDGLVGSWQEDEAFDTVIAAQDQVDPHLWK